MNRRLPSLAAACLGLLPSAALAHGDHTGATGLVHLLTSPDHLGYATVLAIMAAPLLAERLYGMLRRNIGKRSPRCPERKGVA